MAKKPLQTLKDYFKVGKRPTESQFEDFIDSFAHLDGPELEKIIENVNSNNGYLEFTNQNGNLVTQISFQDIRNNMNIPANLVQSVNGQSGNVSLSMVQSVNGQTGNVTLPIEDSGWQDVTNFSNGAAIYDTNNKVKFRKKNGIVFIEGCIKGVNAQTNGLTHILFNLPLEYRPSRKISFAILRANTALNNYLIGRVDIDSNGNVYGVNYSNLWNSLSGISFVV